MPPITLHFIRALVVATMVLLCTCSSAIAQDEPPSAFAEVEAEAAEHFDDGVQAQVDGRYAEALQHFHRVIELDDLDEGTLYMVADALYAIAEIHQAEHRFEECAAYAARSAPGLHVPGHAYDLQATCLMQAGRYEDALAALQTGVEDDWAHMELYVLAAHASKLLERTDDAFDWLYDALEVDFEYPEVHYRLADYRSVEEDLPLVLGLSYALLLDEDASSRAHNAREVLVFVMQPPHDDTFVQDLEYFIGEYRARFAALGDLAAPEETRDPFWTHYVPFFKELHQAGYMEALVHYLFERSGGDHVTGGDVWLEANRDALDDFLRWLDETGRR